MARNSTYNFVEKYIWNNHKVVGALGRVLCI